MAVKDTGIVNIHGREYSTVAKRVAEFREKYGDQYSITTGIVDMNDDAVVIKASISKNQGPKGELIEPRVIATGHAEERRASSQINRTSALENCETSAIGRALAAFGLAGSEFASADEVAQAMHQQASSPSGPAPSSDRPASDKQKQLLTKLLGERGVSKEDMPGYLIEQYGISDPKNMTSEQASFAIDDMIGDGKKEARVVS